MDDASSLLQETLRLQQEKLGSAHADTLKSMILLAGVYTQQRQYVAAQSLLLKVVEARPLDAPTWWHLGLVQLANGDKEAYQRNCHELLGRYLESAEPPFTGWELAWCCKQAAILNEDIQQVERFARASHAAQPDDSRARIELACVLFRAGNYAESLEHLQALWDNDVPLRAFSGFWLSMTHARLGNAPEAQRYFDLSVEASKDPSWPAGSCTALEHELLRREAESLLHPAQRKPDESPAGDGNK